jgi:hypothetical protein
MGQLNTKRKKDFNPMHYCLQCETYLGHRGWCSQKCHDDWYNKQQYFLKKKTINSKKELEYF